MRGIPAIGQKATITVKNFSAMLTGPLAHTCPKTLDIVGVIALRPKWETDPNSFALYVNGSDVPLRIIRAKDVVAINGRKFESNASTRIIREEFKVPGSKGQTYIVQRNGESWRCTCPGFGFRHTCRHVDQLRNSKA